MRQEWFSSIVLKQMALRMFGWIHLKVVWWHRELSNYHFCFSGEMPLMMRWMFSRMAASYFRANPLDAQEQVSGREFQRVGKERFAIGSLAGIPFADCFGIGAAAK
jgi:hypothetical protein